MVNSESVTDTKVKPQICIFFNHKQSTHQNVWKHYKSVRLPWRHNFELSLSLIMVSTRVGLMPKFMMNLSFFCIKCTMSELVPEFGFNVWQVLPLALSDLMQIERKLNRKMLRYAKSPLIIFKSFSVKCALLVGIVIFLFASNHISTHGSTILNAHAERATIDTYLVESF